MLVYDYNSNVKTYKVIVDGSTVGDYDFVVQGMPTPVTSLTMSGFTGEFKHKNNNNCEISDIGSDFLYKPDTRVIFFPSVLIDRIVNAKACTNIECTTMVQNLQLRERVWRGSPLYHATFSQNIPLYIIITIDDGRQLYWYLPNPTNRYYMPHWESRGGIQVGAPRIIGCN